MISSTNLRENVNTAILLLMTIPLASAKKRFDADYCSDGMSCNGGKKKHLLCKFKHESSIGECTNIRDRMTPEERMHILNNHNIFRNGYGMDPLWGPKPPHPDDKKYAAPLPSNWASAFGGALCIRQLTWSYDNEKAAQIWAEQCKGDNETYDCITDFKEGFRQYMNVYTADGTLNGGQVMYDAVEAWKSTNLSMPGDRKQKLKDDWTSVVYDKNKLGNFNFNKTVFFHPWASLVYWMTFLLGCGKTHFQQGGKPRTRIVCVYGPGINHIEVLKKEDRQLYVKPNPLNHLRQCRMGHSGIDPDNYPYARWHYPSCPVSICRCIGALDPSITVGNENATHFINYTVSDWVWLCVDDCQARQTKPVPIPGLMGYITGSEATALSYSACILLVMVSAHVHFS